MAAGKLSFLGQSGSDFHPVDEIACHLQLILNHLAPGKMANDI